MGVIECHWFDFSGWFWAESSSGLKPLPQFWQQRSGVNISQVSLVIFVPTNGNYFRMQKTVNTYTQGPPPSTERKTKSKTLHLYEGHSGEPY